MFPSYLQRHGPFGSGDIQSGIIGSVHIQDGTIVTADLASGALGSGELASGSVGGFFGTTRHVQSGTLGNVDFGSGAVLSGSIASGNVWGLVGSLPHVASGSFTGFELGSGSVVSGRVASGQIGNFHVASGQVQGLAGAGVPNVASGTFTGFELGSGSVVSGRVASGQLGESHLASGVKDHGLLAGGAPFVSGTTTPIPTITSITAENISGGRAVCFNQSGQLVVAMAATSGRRPAIGVTTSMSGNALSGLTVSWMQVGGWQGESGLADYSGYLQRRVWLGRSGQITTISGSWSSGGFASGDVGQPLGVIANSGGIIINVFPFMVSGGPLGLAAGGPY